MSVVVVIEGAASKIIDARIADLTDRMILSRQEDCAISNDIAGSAVDFWGLSPAQDSVVSIQGVVLEFPKMVGLNH